MWKVDDGEKKKKIMSFLVATNIVASRPPVRRLTGTPHARANWTISKACVCVFVLVSVCQMIAMCNFLSVTQYLWLALIYLLSESFYLKLAVTCKNLSLSLVVVRLVFFKSLVQILFPCFYSQSYYVLSYKDLVKLQQS